MRKERTAGQSRTSGSPALGAGRSSHGPGSPSTHGVDLPGPASRQAGAERGRGSTAAFRRVPAARPACVRAAAA
ncbi:hypothetical protein G6F22_021545 [Rhizopus arrhizus]|nr:hypothetical protein G6F22_021545 [Rhizopus arrhizus]